jgi:hypothetical protein
MGARERNESIAFQKAKAKRAGFITKLENCDVQELMSVQKRWNKLHSQPFPALNNSHSAAIKHLDNQIVALLKSKAQQFASDIEAGPQEAAIGSAEILAGQQAALVDPEILDSDEVDSEVSTEELSSDTDDELSDIDYHQHLPARRAVSIGFSPYSASFVNRSVTVAASAPPSFNPPSPVNLKEVRKHLNIMMKKAEVFYRKPNVESSVSYTTHDLADGVFNMVNNIWELVYACETNRLPVADFKKQAKAYLNSSNSLIVTLAEHRGWKQIIVNLLAAIVGNVVYAVAAAAKGQLMLFKPATDSINKVNALRNAIEHVPETAPSVVS